MAAAEKTIAAAREGASAHIRTTAQGAAIEIVERLIGERVSEADAADAVAARR
jgi:F0F1-type ATP synthase membrane subunit b/b'